MSEYNCDTKKEQAIKLRRSKKIPLIIGAAVAVFLIIVIGVIISIKVYSTETGTSLQEQLDLGNKYLNELNYEQAIVEYEVAIKIDPMSVDAYLGLADAYVGQGKIGNAIEILEQGYEKTGSQLMLDKINELLNVSTQSVIQTVDIMANQISIDKDIPASVVDGVYHRAYYAFDLTTEQKAYLDLLIEKLESGSRDEFFEFYNSDEANIIIDAIRSEYDSEVYMPYGVSISYNNRKIFLENGGGAVQPVDNGMGYIFNQSEVSGGGTTRYENYIQCECQNGIFNGKFSGIHYSDWDGVWYTNYYTGTVLNGGILDGELYITENSPYTGHTEVIETYNMGKLYYWDVQEHWGGKVSFQRAEYIVGDERRDYEYLEYVYENDLEKEMQQRTYILDWSIKIFHYVDDWSALETDGGKEYFKW